MNGSLPRDLSKHAIAWGQRPAQVPACQLTTRDIDLLALLHDVGTLPTSTINELFWGNTATACHERLKRLHDVGLLDRFRPTLPRWAGRHEWIHRLSTAGWETLRRADRVADEEPYRPQELHSPAYAEHDLDVADLILSLARRYKPPEQTRQPLREIIPFEWHGPRRALHDPHAPLPPNDRAPEALLDPATVHEERSVNGRIRPDAALIGPGDNGAPTAILLEYDRTRRPSKQRDRLRRYDALLTYGWQQSHYARMSTEPAVLFICANEVQMSRFAATADTELTAWLGTPRSPGQDRDHPARDQIAFTSYQRMRTGDWRMLQVPHLPPSARQPRSGAAKPRTLIFDVPAAFTRADTAHA